MATEPALAKEVGVGRPDIPGADDYGLIDVNHCPADALARLPGMTSALARRTVRERLQAGGFSSVEDLGLLLDLPPEPSTRCETPPSSSPTDPPSRADKPLGGHAP
jgi:helix-hairpin-helix protein